jgi:hypothetical protein
MNFEIIPDRPDSIPELTVKLRALGGELRGQTRGVLAEALREGQLVAEREAPRGMNMGRRLYPRISDSIRVEDATYSPGGAGGGGFYTGRLYADSAVAPQLQYVMEGTADHGRGLIRPSRGNVMVFQKLGEPTRFRHWVHGQRANTRWWDDAHEAVRHSINTNIGR